MIDPEKEKELKLYFFQEYSRLIQEREDNQRIYDKFIKERSAFNEDMKTMNAHILRERKKLKEDNLLFDKKVAILQNGFLQLDLERKQFEKNKADYSGHKDKKNYRSGYEKRSNRDSLDTSMFFAGVSNSLALKKRYKDLLKIYHPDNICGDASIVKAINEEFEKLKKQF